MYIVILKNNENNVILNMGEKLDHMSNGYPRLVNENIAFPTDMVNIYEVEEVPSEVIPIKYCYTENDGFFLNPNYEEPNAYGIPNEVYNSILDDYTNELIESGVL